VVINPDLANIHLICFLADLLRDRHHVAIGANSPAPTAAALLARHISKGRIDLTILGSRRYNRFSGLADFWDLASRGRFDGFFLSPGQIDGQGNINMVGVGEYPRLDVRWPGSHGSPLLYMMIPNIILFRDVHKRRIFVPRVDFISAAGFSPPGVYRPGGPSDLVTSLGHFSFNRNKGRFRLEAVHPGHDAAEIAVNTMFDFDRPDAVPATSPPSTATLDMLSGPTLGELGEIYPQFTKKLRDALASDAVSNGDERARRATGT
jgi:glutaconate CoA-transferase, subunit B